jgi:hypothetical protein
MTRTPWLEALVEDLSAGFAQRGVPAVAVADRSYAPGALVSTPLVLGGEIRDFSTEGRFLGLMAHVSGIIRLYDQQGGLLVEKRLSARVRPAQGAGPVYETMLNDAVQQFVRQAVMDPDLAQRLVAAQ